MAGALKRWGLVLLLGQLIACGGEDKPTNAERNLSLPTQPVGSYVTDQAKVGGIHFELWDEGGGCKLKFVDAEQWLKPMAPCYFMRSPGREMAQVFRQDKTTRIVAVVGTPAKGDRCGQEVQGVIVQRAEVHLSRNVMQGSVACASQGLHNFQYSLLGK